MTVPRRPAGLDEKLAAYTSMLGANGSASSGASGWSRWPVYAAAVGSSFALASAAEASSIVYSGLQNVTRQIEGQGVGGFSNTFGINLDGVGGADFRLIGGYHRRFHSGLKVSGSASLRGNGNASQRLLRGTGPGILKKLASGSVISNGAGIFDAIQHVVHHQGRDSGAPTSSGTWPANATGFAGVKLGSNFGWIRLKWTDDIFNPGNLLNLPDSITVVDWAMETTGQSIRAGDTGITAEAVLEPGSLALLATGAAGLLAWRRRQKQRVKAQV